MAFVPSFLDGFEIQGGSEDGRGLWQGTIDTTGLTYDSSITYNSRFSAKFAMSANTGSFNISGIYNAWGRWGGSEKTQVTFAYHLYVETLPGVGQYFYLHRSQDIATNHGRVRLNEDGKFEIVDSGSTVRGTSTNALSTGTWYGINFSQDGANGTIVSFYDLSSDTLIEKLQYSGENRDPHETWLGPWNTSTGTCYFDNVVIAVDQEENFFDTFGTMHYAIGDLQPTGAGTDNTPDSGTWADADDLITGECDYDTTEIVIRNTLAEYVGVAIEATSTLEQVPDSIKAVAACSQHEHHAGTIANNAVFMRIGGGGTRQTSQSYQHGATYGAASLVRTTDPDGAAWSTAVLDALDIGGRVSGSITRYAGVSALWAAVLYTFTPAAPTGTGRASNFFF